MNVSLAERLMARPGLVLWIGLALFLLSLLPLGRLGPTIDYRVYFDPDDPQLQAMREFEHTFIKDNTLMIVVAPRQGGVFAPEPLRVLTELTEAGWKIPHSIRVDSLINYQHSEADGDELRVRTLFDELTPEAIAAARDIVMSRDHLVGDLVSRAGNVAKINIHVSIPDNALVEVPEITSHARALLADYRQRHPNIDFMLTGTVMADQSFHDAIEQDGRFLTPLSYLLIFGLIWFLLRNLTAMLITLAVILLSVLTALAVKALFNSSLNPVTVVAPSIIMIVAVADSVHLFVTLFQQMALGKSKDLAMRESLRVNLQPVVLTSVTTAIGFLCLNFNESPPLRDMGNTVAVGVLAAMVLSLTLLPALVLKLPLKSGAQYQWSTRWMVSLGDWVIGNRLALVFASGAITAILTIGLLNNELNEVFAEYFDETFEFRRANDFVDSHMAGMGHINYTLDSGSENGIFDPEYLKTLAAFVRYLDSQPEVTQVISFLDVIKRLNQNMHGDDPAYYRLPETRDEAAQYTLLYELSLPYGQDINHLISMDKRKTRVTLTMKLSGSNTILAVDQRAQAWLERNAPQMATRGVSIDTMFSHIARNNIGPMVWGTTLALVLISGLILLAMRSVRIGLISLLPNLLPMLMAFGFWGFLHGRIGLTESVITSLALGLIVDDTVHFLSKYLRARRELGYGVDEAIRYAYRTVGIALVITTVIFAVGFGILGFSHYLNNSHLGILTALTILFALAADLLFLPAFLSLLGRRRESSPGLPASSAS